MHRSEAWARRQIASGSRGPKWWARFTGRRLTSRNRALPKFLIVGAAKAGTTTLHHYLARHPATQTGVIKEIHYFDRPQNYAGGLGWYRAHFPDANEDLVAFESTPSYLSLPFVPLRIKNDLPGVKLVVLLRNPTDRAISNYQHNARLGHEPLGLAEALAAEDGRLGDSLERGTFDRALTHFSYRTQGIYADQIERYLGHFPRSKLHIVASEDLFANPNDVVGGVLEFLDLAPLQGDMAEAKLNATDDPIRDNRVREELNEFYAPHNARLEGLLGRSMGWS